MKYFKIVFLFALTIDCFAGSLFSFEAQDIQMAALNWVQIQDSQLVDQELEFDHINPELKKGGEDLITSVFFKYKDKNPDNKIGLLYVCVKLDENGQLKAYNKDIPSKRIAFGIITPVAHICLAQQS